MYSLTWKHDNHFPCVFFFSQTFLVICIVRYFGWCFSCYGFFIQTKFNELKTMFCYQLIKFAFIVISVIRTIFYNDAKIQCQCLFKQVNNWKSTHRMNNKKRDISRSKRTVKRTRTVFKFDPMEADYHTIGNNRNNRNTRRLMCVRVYKSRVFQLNECKICCTLEMRTGDRQIVSTVYEQISFSLFKYA